MSLELDAFGEEEVADVGTSDCQVIKLLWLFALLLHFNTFKMRIHRHVNTRYGADYDWAIFKFDGDSLSCEFHQEFY